MDGSSLQVFQKCSAPGSHLNLSCVLDIAKEQQPCSPSSERAPTPALVSVVADLDHGVGQSEKLSCVGCSFTGLGR